MIHGSGFVPNVTSQFPAWVVRKIGEPLLLESDWNYASLPNAKFGMFADGTGSLAKETTNFFWGGAGSCKMLTDATIAHSAEVKCTIHAICNIGDLLSFEMKWVQAYAFGASKINWGLESRDLNNILHGRFQYQINVGKWQYEDNNLVYQDFPSNVGGALSIPKPTINTSAGNIVGWARCIIDPYNKIYVGFEAGGQNGKIETRDMRPMNLPLSSEGSSGGNPDYLPFVMAITGGSGAEASYTTDWCVSRIPKGISPF